MVRGDHPAAGGAWGRTAARKHQISAPKRPQNTKILKFEECRIKKKEKISRIEVPRPQVKRGWYGEVDVIRLAIMVRCKYTEVPGQRTKTWSQKASPLNLQLLLLSSPSAVLSAETARIRRLSSVGDQVWVAGLMVRVAPVALNCANRARA